VVRILIVSENVGEGYGTERIVASSTAALREAGHSVEWIGDVLRGEVTAHAFHRLPELFHLNSISHRRTLARALESLLRIAGASPAESTIVHFVDHPDARILEAVAKRIATVFTAHTAAATCPASGRFVRNLPVCPERSGWACLRHHFRYGCLSAQRSPLHRAHAVFEFQRKHAGLHHAHRILAVSHFLEEQLIRDGYRRSQVAYVPNPVEAPPASVGSDFPPNLLVAAARLVPMKGIAPLIEALKSIEDEEWTLWIVGEGSEREPLGNLVEKLELSSRIRFVGRKSRAEISTIFRAATAVIQPNLGPEGFGLSVAEASLLGKPVIAFDVPGLNEIIEHEKTGLLIKHGDRTALGLAISRVLDNEEWSRSLGEAGSVRVRDRYSREKHLEETLKNYALALEAKR
jgi:glycosyltransferase involved in cell wall biosynthesis